MDDNKGSRITRWIAITGAVCALAGCGSKTPPPAVTFVAPQTPYQPAEASGNGFDAYCRAALEAEKADPTLLRKVAFTDREYAQLATTLSRPLSGLESGIGKMTRFEFRPVGPFQPQPYSVGWRILGEAMIGQLQAAVKEKNEGRIAQLTGNITQFGFDLTHGDGGYAIQGYGLVDRCRKLVTPVLKDLSSGTLSDISSRVAIAIKSAAPLDETLANEAQTAGLSLQTIQQMHMEGKFDVLREYLGSGGKDLVDYLKNIDPTSSKRRDLYDQVKQRYDDEMKLEQDRAKAVPSKQEDFPKDSGKKEIRTMGRMFAQLGRTLIVTQPLVITRSKLFALYAHCQARVAAGQPVQAQLSGMPQEMMTDPFSGQSFVYHTNGTTFEIYSVGKNGTDDDGKGGPSGTDPDVRLENFDI